MDHEYFSDTSNSHYGTWLNILYSWVHGRIYCIVGYMVESIICIVGYMVEYII